VELILSDVQIPLEKDGPAEYLKAAALRLGDTAGKISVAKILSKSLDARRPDQFFYKVSLVVRTADRYANPQGFPVYRAPVAAPRPTASRPGRPLIVGFGPAGMFAALELIDCGLKPLIFERGKKIEERSVDVEKFIADRVLNPESNIQFGEGGAGSFSDGKLFSRRDNNTSYVNRVLRTFIKFGAPPEIEYIGKPHLGTDLLCVIVRNIRNHILERGGEIRYGANMTDLLVAGGRAAGLVINGAEEYPGAAIFLALGHSARDTMAMLEAKGVALARKPIAVGVRIEHPVATVNLMRYGAKYHDFPGLGAATYSLNYTNRQSKRGVYTFCMCPGGEVVNASSEPGLLVLNGMSYSHRALPYSNAALVVSCHANDYPAAGPLAGLEFQRAIERQAFRAGGGDWGVPAQNLLDFLGGTASVGLNENSYRMGVVPAELRDLFPGFVVAELAAAFEKWRAEVPLFVSRQAILLGAETRTSSPVRINRTEKFESVNIKDLYPIGEGSGYTGGITSSAADAIRAVEIYVRQG
jgi:hypothetical protein